MFPFFNVTLAERFRMNSQDMPTKGKKKKVQVPVHTSRNEVDDVPHRTFSANFNPRGKQKTVEFADLKKSPKHDNVYDDNSNRSEISKTDAKVSKKILNKEIQKLTSANLDLSEKLANSENVFTKKISRMKEKVTALQNHNKQFQNENELFRERYQELLHAYEESKAEIEAKRTCASCEQLKLSLEKSSEEYNLLHSNNKDLLEDITMLKNVVYRLNVQMERYQEKIRNPHERPIRNTPVLPADARIENEVSAGHHSLSQALSAEHADHHHTPISWGKVNAHTLGPLLDSYQETIDEKDDIIAAYETELSKFTGKLKEIIAENETLHRRLTEDDVCSEKLVLELENVKSELKHTKQQNDMLIKKCALKQDKVEEILKCYEHKVEQLQRDYKVVHEEYVKSRSEIIALREKNKSLIDAKEEFKNERENYIPLSVHAASVNECKRLYEELKEQYENEKAKLKDTISSQNAQITDLNAKISALVNEKGELETKIKSLEKLVKKAESKYVDLQRSLSEVQHSRSACRRQLHKAMNFAKDLVSEQEALIKALSARQQENKVVKKLGSDIASRMDSLKNQLKNVQRDAWQELSTVEQRLQEQDSLITTMKQEHLEEVEKLKEIIRNKEKSNLLLGDDVPSIPLPHYLLYRDRNIDK